MRATKDQGFRVRTYDKTIAFNKSFERQLRCVIDGLRGSSVPELITTLSKLPSGDGPLIGAFFTFFAAHELLHVEQGLGSDQYKDADFYMPAVMEADYVTDISGLAVCLAADIPHLASLSRREKALLLIAIHLFSMHSFVGANEAVTGHTFNRLVIWYLHFARVQSVDGDPDFSRPSFARSWVVMFPKLVSDRDGEVTSFLLEERSDAPLAATSDIVLAYHRDNGLFRLHRAVLTDAGRSRRICEAVIEARFDDVRADLEELLIDNPSLTDSTSRGGGELGQILSDLQSALGGLRQAVAGQDADKFENIFDDVRISAARLPGAVSRAVDHPDEAAPALAEIRDCLEGIEDALGATTQWGAVRKQIRRLYLPIDTIAAL